MIRMEKMYGSKWLDENGWINEKTEEKLKMQTIVKNLIHPRQVEFYIQKR